MEGEGKGKGNGIRTGIVCTEDFNLCKRSGTFDMFNCRESKHLVFN